MMLMTDKTLKSYSDTSYHSEELKSLTRYRFAKVQERAKLKSSVARLVNILFPELEKIVPSLHMASVYALISEFPGASLIADCHLTHLKNLLETASKGLYGRDMAITIRDVARDSIGSVMPTKSMELKHTIHLIEVMTEEIDEIEASIKSIMDTCNSPIMTIPGISYRIGAMILAEIGDFTRFRNADQILAFAGLSPSTYRSGLLDSSYPTWKNVDHVICDMLYSMLRNSSANGMETSGLISQRRYVRASTTMLLSVTQRRNWYVPSTGWNLQAKPTENKASLASYFFLRAPVQMLCLSCDFQGTH